MNVKCLWQFSVIADDPASVSAEADRIMEQLLALEDAAQFDSAVSLDLASMLLDVSLVVSCDTFEEALQRGASAIRAAIHAAGGSTAGWPDHDGLIADGLRLVPGQFVAA